ncbi:sugar porter family MFS transporter [Bifidobacterium callitrichidarum]|uniref:sugar porter family MFS transporter n=1 Tax=Bifidobacterium callitrichidarum TaxID=2052941 RepID=UPI001F4ED6DD|nr:sugar porter family MFS transporter [Bifidobacterium callitrichidarum]
MGTTIRAQGSGKYTFGLALSAGLAGLLYGYDTVSISGAIEFLRFRYGLSTLMEGLVISSIMLGAVIGAATAGFLSDRFGRRRILIIGGAFFFVAAIWSALTFGPIDLIVARVVGGYGIGLTSALAVTYITESAPTSIRGLLSFSYQLLAVCGIFLTNVINYIIASYGSSSWDISTGWRWMLGLGAIPAAAFLLAMTRAPESPRFLIQVGKTDEGFAVLEHILGTERARLRTDDIRASVKLENEMSSEFHDLFRPGLRRALAIGIFLAVFNQFVGMSAISYYGPVMFAKLGFGGDTEFLTAASVGGVELVATVVGMYLIDTFGRKRLMEVGTGMMCVFALCISIAYMLDSSLLALVFVMAFTVSFAFSMGPIPWIVIPELFPTYLRGRATGLCVMCLLFANWVIAQFTPLMIDGLGGGVSFALFGVLNLVCLLGIITLVPETMGRTLEEIEHLWQPKTKLAAAKYTLSSANANIRHAEATLRRVENERQQALGIMAAAQRARVEAQQKVFDLEAAEKAEEERLAAEQTAEKAAEEARKTAMRQSSGADKGTGNAKRNGAADTEAREGREHESGQSTQHDSGLLRALNSVVITDEVTRAVQEASERIAQAIAQATASAAAQHASQTDGTEEVGDSTADGDASHEGHAPMLDEAAAEAAARAAVDALVDSLPADLSELVGRRSGTANRSDESRPKGLKPTSISSVERFHDADAARGVLLPSAREEPFDERTYHEAEDAREARAIDEALDSLDALIKA